MKSVPMTLAVCGLAAVMTTGAFAQQRDVVGDVPYQSTYKLQNNDLNQARLILPARMHPEVEVSRSLHEQPVWPWMAKVVLGGSQGFAANTLASNPVPDHPIAGLTGHGLIISTYVDPMQRLDGNNGLDSNHTLVRAQRLHQMLMGVTTEDIAALRNAAVDAEPRGSIANHAILIIPPQHFSNDTGHALNYDIDFSHPRPASMPEHEDARPVNPPIPSVPRQAPEPTKSLADAN